MSNPLREIGKLGQSVWYDNLGRDLIRSGVLAGMIEEDGITGVTSNPTIFQKAIGGSKTYDNQLHELVDRGMDVYGIYEGLVLDDIRAAADLLLPVFERTRGVDGYVSLEVAPDLAYDTAKTVDQGKRLFELVDRKNLMIKVPATPQGFPAIRELISVGVNVNVTLIFSLDQYRQAAEAYLEGIEERIGSGGAPADTASVASFFVSRVDTLVDERLQELAHPGQVFDVSALRGKTAIANAKIAYAMYKELFHGEPFARSREMGARPQRVLWASTSTKNPDYPDTLYVDALLGPETVNTLPQATLDAFRDHGEPAVRLEDGLDEARELFPRLEEIGINIDQVMQELLDNGIKSFADSFERLLQGIAEKRTRLLRGWGHRSASLGGFQEKVDEALARCDKEKVSERIWSGDTSLWKTDPEHRGEIGQRLGWMHAVDTMSGETERLRNFADEIRGEGFTNVVLLGMGGSSLSAEVFSRCLGVADGFPDLKVLDTTIPGSILEAERGVDLERTLFIVSSKSGGTIEVLSLYKYFRKRIEEIAGGEAGKHFTAITDPGTSLGKLASEQKFRRVFLNPPDIGGRFSALSYFGLVPAALIGADLDRLLMRASQAVESSSAEVPPLENPCLWLGAIMAQASLSGIDKLSIILSPPLRAFGLWLEQLIAESTGKDGKGIVPIDGEPWSGPESYGNDRLFVYLRLDEDGTCDQYVSAMERAGHPVVTLRLHTAYDLGREMFRWQFATAIAGAIMEINPFDQPNVQESKDLTGELLGRFRSEGELPSDESLGIDDPGLGEALKELMSTIKTGDYVGLNAYLRPSAETVEALDQLRGIALDRYKVATTVGFGPRFLHSTGQLHKGGPDKGVFVQITAEDPEDLEIPGESYSFGVLKNAQALGDYEALKRRNRRILRVRLSSDVDAAKLVDIFRNQA
jgi:transaldolase/glucose-6-phosphate isomerase